MQEQQNPQELMDMARQLLGTVLGEATIDTLCMLIVAEVVENYENPREMMDNLLNTLDMNATSVIEQHSHKGTLEKGHMYAHFVKEADVDTFGPDVRKLATDILLFKAQVTQNKTAEALKAMFTLFVADNEALIGFLKPKEVEIENWHKKQVSLMNVRMDSLKMLKGTIAMIAERKANIDITILTETAQQFCNELDAIRAGAVPHLAGKPVSKDNNKDLDIIQSQVTAAQSILEEMNAI